MLASHAFRMRVQCSGCRENIPLNNLMSSLRCHRCGEINKLDDAFWRENLLRPAGAGGGAVMVIRPNHRGRTCVVESTETAACPECDATFDVALLAAGTTAMTCRQGHAIAVWPADPIALAVFPGARFVVAEPPATTPVTPGAKLTVLACASCGAALDTDGSTRVITCSHCDATNVMSDAMSPKSRIFCIVVEDGRPERTEADRRWDIATTTASPDKLRELARDPSPRVRKAVADGPRTPADVLAILAEDPDPAVRKAATGNRHFVPPPAADPVPGKLAALEDPQLAHDALFALAEDPDAQVAETAKARIAQMRLTGELPPEKKRGFFSKLFGGD